MRVRARGRERAGGAALLKDQHVAQGVVVDEWGGTAGLVTVEGIFEEVVGDLRVEGEEAYRPVVEIERGRYDVDGSLSIRDWNQFFGQNVAPREFETVGGLCTALLWPRAQGRRRGRVGPARVHGAAHVAPARAAPRGARARRDRDECGRGGAAVTIAWIVLLALSFALSALFSGSETALYSVTRSRIEAEALAGGRSAALIRSLMRHDGWLLATLLVGNNVVNELSTVAADGLVSRLGVPRAWTRC